MSIQKLLLGHLGVLAAFAFASCSETTKPDVNNNGVDALTQAVTDGPKPKKVEPKIAVEPLVDGKKYPVAKPSSRPGVVVSPYKPYNLVGVKNYKSGDKARDPYTKQIFLVP